jgi:UDP-N-acetylmuramate--alanine ligase
VWKSFGYENSDVLAENVKVRNGRFEFNYVTKEGEKIKNIRSALPGRHNIENALAALTVGLELGLGKKEMKKTIGNFKGIFRRFERLYESDDLVYIDDYAHHPTELRAAIGATKELYPDHYLLGIFQPHLFSRTRDFVDGFAQALEMLDEVILMDIYPAREEPIPGIESNLILSKIKKENKHLISEENAIIERLEKMPHGVILTLGAGDIDLLRDPIIKMLNKND